MFGKKILVMVSSSGRRYLVISLIVVFVTVLISAIVFGSQNTSPLENKNIIIDPGHGGVDSGTTDYSQFHEKDINLQIAKKLQKVLISARANVDLTRDGDYALDDRNTASSSRHTRDLIARVDQFNSGKYDLFISIHVNRSSNQNAIGPIVMYSSRLPSTELLACCIQDKMNEHTKNNIGLNIRHNAVKSDYYILVNSNIPGIIVETGFISNPREKSLLTDDGYQMKLVDYLHKGLVEYFTSVRDINRNGSEGSPPQAPIQGEDEIVPSNVINEVRMVKN